MKTVVLGEQPLITEWLERRRVLGQDRYDEVWEGSYHVAPNARHEHGVAALQIMIELEQDARRQGLISTGPFNLGEGEDDYRVPDGGWTRGTPQGLYVPTAEAVLEVLSPDDETYGKVDFYFRRGVREVLIAHPTERWVRCYTTPDGVQLDLSQVIGRDMRSLASQVRWP